MGMEKPRLREPHLLSLPFPGTLAHPSSYISLSVAGPLDKPPLLPSRLLVSLCAAFFLGFLQGCREAWMGGGFDGGSTEGVGRCYLVYSHLSTTFKKLSPLLLLIIMIIFQAALPTMVIASSS